MSCVAFAGPILALLLSQSPTANPLQDANARRLVAIDRVDRIVLNAVQLARRDPDSAKTALENAKREVESELALPEDRRISHLKLLNSAIGRLPPNPSGQPDSLGQPRRLLPSVSKFPTQSNRGAPAGSPAEIAQNMMGKNREGLARNADFRANAAAGRDQELRRIEANAAAPDRDSTLPPDYAEKNARRLTDGRFTNTQKKIIAGLNKPLTANIDAIDLQGFFDWVEKQTGIYVQIDKQALETIGVGMQTEVPVKSRGLAARTVLRKVLSELGAAYIVSDDGLKITSLEVAKNTMVTRVHYVGDLVYAVNNYQFQPLPAQYNAAAFYYGLPGLAAMQQQAWNAPWLNQLQMNQNVQSLIDMVKGTGDLDSWEPVGQGRVTYDPISKSLIVKQTAEYHFKNGP